eukprot:6005773-Karenia_brevis.AAC.1
MAKPGERRNNKLISASIRKMVNEIKAKKEVGRREANLMLPEIRYKQFYKFWDGQWTMMTAVMSMMVMVL